MGASLVLAALLAASSGGGEGGFPAPSTARGVYTFAVSQGEGRVWFKLGAVAHAVEGDSDAVTGWMSADPDRPETARAAFFVPADSLTTRMSFRDGRMRRDYLETGKFPRIAFELVSAGAVERLSPDHARFRAEGLLSLHGFQRRVSFPVEVELETDGTTLEARGSGSFSLKEFGIPVPTFLFIPATYEVIHGGFEVRGRRVTAPPPPSP